MTIDGWSEPASRSRHAVVDPGLVHDPRVRAARAGLRRDERRPPRPLGEDRRRTRGGSRRRCSGRVKVSYRVYAHDLTVRTCHLDGTHGFANGAAVFLFVSGHTQEPVTLEVTVPARWQVATGLEPLGGGNGIFRFKARDYDELVDGPVECGTHRLLEFDVDGDPAPHRAVGPRQRGRDAARSRTPAPSSRRSASSSAACRTSATRSSTTSPRAAAGSSTATARSSSSIASGSGRAPRTSASSSWSRTSSSTCGTSSASARSRSDRSTTARENHTRQLWTMEGVTSYYEKRFVRGGGAVLEGALPRARRARRSSSLQAQPGRTLQSLEQSSFDAWIKHYRPDENSANVERLVLPEGRARRDDARPRDPGAAPARKKCLDDVVRHLAHQATLDDAGFAEPDGYLAAVENGGRGSRRRVQEVLRALRRRDGRARLRRRRSGHAGLAVSWSRPRGPGRRARRLARLLGTRADGRRWSSASVRSDGPAEAAGLYAGDELVAIDGATGGRRATRGRGWPSGRPGRRVRVDGVPPGRAASRSRCRWASAPPETAAIVPIERRDRQQAALREAWLAPFQRELRTKKNPRGIPRGFPSAARGLPNPSGGRLPAELRLHVMRADGIGRVRPKNSSRSLSGIDLAENDLEREVLGVLVAVLRGRSRRRCLSSASAVSSVTMNM